MRPRRPRRPARCSPTSSARSRSESVQPSEVIWMNGEFVRWEDAQVHVLTHALHYGTSVFEGVRCYDTEIGPAVFRNQDHVERLFRSSSLYYMDDPVRARADPPGDARDDRPQQPALLLHPPARLPRLRDDGAVPARGAGRRGDRRLGVGRLPRRGGQAERHPREGQLLAADQPRLADPAGEGRRAVPQQRPGEDRDPQGRLRRGDPARRPRTRLRGLGREHLRRARRCHPHAAADRVDPRRDQPAHRRSRSPATSASRWSSATSRAPSSTSPTRSS